MDEKGKTFLFDLLNTPSPSGFEADIQKKWREYIRPFADRVESDDAGNVFGILNPEAPYRVMIAGHCDEIGFLVSRIEDQGFLRLAKLGGISPQLAPGMKLDILGSGGRLSGVVGVNAEHHGGAKEDLKVEDLYVDCGASSKKEIQDYVRVGDPAIYRREAEELLNGRITGRGLDNRTGAFIVAEVLRRVAKKGTQVGLYAASTVNEETNMGGAYFAASRYSPNMAIATDVTFATDYPGVDRNKQGEVDLDKGPVLASGAPINRKINRLLEEAADRLGIRLQYELTPRSTGTDADRMRLTGRGVPIALVSLPLRYMHAPVEVVSLKDIEAEIDLLTEMITRLSGSESLNPLDD